MKKSEARSTKHGFRLPWNFLRIFMGYSNVGFTLLEILIATSIVAVLGVVISQVLSTTTRTNTKVGIISDVKQNGDYALLTMDRLIRSARRSTCSGAADAFVTLENLDGGITTLGCAWNSSVGRIASVSANGTSYLTGTNVTLGGTDCASDSLTFTCASAGVTSAVSIGFRLSQKSTSPLLFEQSTVSFQSTVTVRNR